MEANSAPPSDPTDPTDPTGAIRRSSPWSPARDVPYDRTLTMLVLGILCAAGGLVGMFTSLSRVRPEPEVFRQFPYLISAVISTGFFVVGALLVLGHFVWRAYNESRTLTRELEEAAASLMWEQLGLGTNGSSSPASSPTRKARASRGRS